jgi:hypothetical protein
MRLQGCAERLLEDFHCRARVCGCDLRGCGLLYGCGHVPHRESDYQADDYIRFHDHGRLKLLKACAMGILPLLRVNVDAHVRGRTQGRRY